MWHGPFRVRELCGGLRCGWKFRALRIDCSHCYISQLKQVKIFPDRLRNQLNVEEANRQDFDESVLPEDGWERTLDKVQFEVEKIMDVRSGRKTRFGSIQDQYLVKW